MSNILFAAAEGLPFIKSGGLADVVGSLPKELAKQGNEVAVVLPLYRAIEKKYYDELRQLANYPVKAGILFKDAILYSCKVEEITYYFIRQDEYFGRDRLYGYYDDGERFAFYCQAILDMFKFTGIPDLIHSHDWHTGMIPLLCKANENPDYQKIKHVYTIHNLAFQGNFPRETLQYFNLSDSFYFNGELKFDGGISYLKAGILFADKITTVSPNYAQEILTAQYGERMQDVLAERQDKLQGIVNGIDYQVWDPETDQDIQTTYSVTSLQQKKEDKKALQREMGLREADDVFLIGIVSRLTSQKGIDLVLEKLQTIMNHDVQLIILGSGDTQYEEAFKQLEWIYPHRAVLYCGYNEQLSHKMYAGLDLLLMPSAFEPCGLSQLIAMRYGTLPLVRETGGLKDTVVPYNQFEDTGWGFSFKNYSGDDLFYILAYAMETYYNHKADWQKLMVRAMSQKTDWANSAAQYLALYHSILD